MNGRITRYDALAAVDGAGFSASPASVLVQEPEAQGDMPRLLAAGTPAEVSRHSAAARAATTNLPTSILIPGLVNAHAHLDLTHIGPRAFDPDRGFTGWVEMIRTEREADDPGIAVSVERGIKLSLAGGTVAVGDIAGAPRGRPSLVPWRTLRRSALMGVSFLEFFAIGKGAERGWCAAEVTVREGLVDSGNRTRHEARLGLQPHAPHTVGLAGFRRAVEVAWASEPDHSSAKCPCTLEHGISRPVPLSTHLAETVEERQFIATADGPHREFLERVGVWSPEVLEEFAKGRTPVEHLFEVLGSASFVAAHVNDADDEAIRLLALTRTSVAYCPRASEYFGAADRFGPHRYRDMMAAGINVALGTDSIVNLPSEAAGIKSGGMSVLDEMRRLFRRDGADPATLLKMGTVNGAQALGLEPDLFRLGGGDTHGRNIAGLVAIEAPTARTITDPARLVMELNSPTRLLFYRSFSG